MVIILASVCRFADARPLVPCLFCSINYPIMPKKYSLITWNGLAACAGIWPEVKVFSSRPPLKVKVLTPGLSRRVIILMNKLLLEGFRHNFGRRHLPGRLLWHAVIYTMSQQPTMLHIPKAHSSGAASHSEGLLKIQLSVCRTVFCPWMFLCSALALLSEVLLWCKACADCL